MGVLAGVFTYVEDNPERFGYGASGAVLQALDGCHWAE